MFEQHVNKMQRPVFGRRSAPFREVATVFDEEQLLIARLHSAVRSQNHARAVELRRQLDNLLD